MVKFASINSNTACRDVLYWRSPEGVAGKASSTAKLTDMTFMRSA